jgi:hypothetical protein
MIVESIALPSPGALENLRKKIGLEKWEKTTMESNT